MLSVKQGRIKYHFFRVFGMTRPGLFIGLVGREIANGPEDQGSIPGRVITKTLKMVLDTALLNTQQYKVRIKGQVEQSRKRSSALPYILV